MKKPLERDIVKKIIEYLKEIPESFWYKSHGGPYQAPGIPDIIGTYKGRFVGLEVKRPGNHATDLQLEILKQIIEARGVGEVVYSVEDVKKVIDMIDSYMI